MQNNLICDLWSFFPFISQLQKLKHDKYCKNVKKCNKQNLNIFTEPNLFIQHHERNWKKMLEEWMLMGYWRNCSQQTSEVGRCYVVIPITGQLCLIVMLVIKVMMFMTCLIFCSESSVIISCFISLFSCQYESKIL